MHTDVNERLLDGAVVGNRPVGVVLEAEPRPDGLQRPVRAAPALVVHLVLYTEHTSNQKLDMPAAPT